MAGGWARYGARSYPDAVPRSLRCSGHVFALVFFPCCSVVGVWLNGFLMRPFDVKSFACARSGNVSFAFPMRTPIS